MTQQQILTTKQSDSTLFTFGGAVRALDGQQGEVGGVLVPWTDETEKDLYGTFFTRNTDYGHHVGNGMDVFLHHGQTIRALVGGLMVDFDRFAKRKFAAPMRTELQDDVGIFASVLLDMNDEYEAAMYDLVCRGVLSWSSGAISHLTDIDPESGEVRRWIIGEGSLTPTPGTPKKRTLITNLRGIMDGTFEPAVITEPPQVQQSPPARSTAQPATTVTDQKAARRTAIRAELLDDWDERQVTMSALSVIVWALQSRIGTICMEEDKTTDQKLAEAQAYLDEFNRIFLGVMKGTLEGIGPESVEEAATAMRTQANRMIRAMSLGSIRAGKALSSANESDITDAIELLQGVLDRNAPASDDGDSERAAPTSRRATPSTPAVPTPAVSATTEKPVTSAPEAVRYSPEMATALIQGVMAKQQSKPYSGIVDTPSHQSHTTTFEEHPP